MQNLYKNNTYVFLKKVGELDSSVRYEDRQVARVYTDEIIVYEMP